LLSARASVWVGGDSDSARGASDTAPPSTRAEPRHASWLELFYDLLFVALFAQLAHGLNDDLRLTVALGAVGLFAPAWWAWVSYTVSTNLFGETEPAHRLLVVVNMVGLLLMTAGVPSAFAGDPVLYATGFALSRLVLLALVGLWHLQHRDAPAPLGSYLCYSASVLLWGISIPIGPPFAYVLWTVSLVVEIAVRLREQSAPHRDGMPSLDVALLVERFGLLVIIALGEGVVQVASAMADAQESTTAVTTGIAAFAVVAALWWYYFDLASSTISAGFRAGRNESVAITRDVFVLGHYFLVGAIVTLSAGLGSIVTAAAHDASFDGALLLVGDSLVVFLAGCTAISVRVHRGLVRSVRDVLPAVPLIAAALIVGDNARASVVLGAVAIGLAGNCWLRRR
jgi:low temperature requirement protein LtrA